MAALAPGWYLAEIFTTSEAWLVAVQQALPRPLAPPPMRAAQLLQQRRLCPLAGVAGFLNPGDYSPTPASAFGEDMAQAVNRLQAAHWAGEKVAIWGDFDADGVTATAILWDGLGRLFQQHERLTYYIPNRMTESHGLSRAGIDQLHRWGATLVVTCDTGSTNGAEIDYARGLGLDVIVTDHHTLPEHRPPVVALINPRSLPPAHPLATLSGVAVAYKLLEGLYAAMDEAPTPGLDSLLDLVAIGLIADLVELRGDCRYLAQRGLQQLQLHLQGQAPYPRPGVAELLTLCKRTGDRPTDISFGLGPRINAVSRIHGNASFCVELLTSQDGARCKTLAHQAELANTRRKALQQDVYNQVMAQVAPIDLATTQCLVLASEQWPVGILGLVAGQVSQQMGRPTVLLRIDPAPADGSQPMARGSARSVQGLDLYELFKAQNDLLSGFGGHPLAAGLTLPADNIPMLRSALNQAVRASLGERGSLNPTLTLDLTVTVAELGQALFRQLKLLEPYGMGNPVPKLLIRNAWFERGFHRNLRDRSGRSVKFIKTEFELWDDTTQAGFPGEWWGHYKDDLPPGRCDLVVELDHNAHQGYHVKLVDCRSGGKSPDLGAEPRGQILDWRQGQGEATPEARPETLVVNQVPLSWNAWQTWQQRADQQQATLALAYGAATVEVTPEQVWQQLVGIAKYLDRTQTPVSREQLQERLQLTPQSLELGLVALAAAGFELLPIPPGPNNLRLSQTQPPGLDYSRTLQQFLETVQEEHFRRRYFAQVSVPTLVLALSQGPQPSTNGLSH
jgi:single-stranded-DNA-specific exonuclease